jgi:hypothetical protein
MSGPHPPLHEVTPFVPQLVLTILCVAGAAGVVGLGIRRWARDRSPVLLLLIAGATVASLQEAPLDIFVSAYYPPQHLWWVYESFGRQVPVWAHFAWMILFAGAPYLLAQVMRRGPLRRVAWLGVLYMAIVDIVIELPAQASHLYFYYGDQPLKVGDFPVTMAVVNAATMMAIAVAIYLGEGRLHGRQRLLALIVPALAVPASTMSLGLPVWTAVGADMPLGVIYLGAFASIALALWAVHGMLWIAERFGPAGGSRVVTGERIRPAPAPA